MKYFLIHGKVKDASKIDGQIMKEHLAYTQKTVEANIALFVSLYPDRKGGVSIMQAESLDFITEYFQNEPFYLNGIQEYEITEITPQMVNPDILKII